MSGVTVVTVAEPETRYWMRYWATPVPPSFDGAVHVTVTRDGPETPTTDVGASGRRDGTAAAAAEMTPDPVPVTVRTRKKYVVPLVRLDTVYVVDVDAVSATTSVQLWPPLIDCSMR